MKDILGNDFFISIAFLSKSPTQAANTAQLAGCTHEQIRAIRNAAKFLRDNGEKEFNKKYMPYKLVDIKIESYNKIEADISINKLYEKRNLNAAEFNELADILESAVSGTKFRLKIKRKPFNSRIKS